MHLPHGLVVAVMDGEKMNLYRNTGDEGHPKLSAMPHVAVHAETSGAGSSHHSSAANPDESRKVEDNFAVSAASWLNQQALSAQFEHLFVIAAPKTLGELRKHLHKSVEQKMLGEMAKDLTGHSIADIEAALAKLP